MADIPTEGGNPFDEETENDNSESSPDGTNDEEDTQSADGDGENNQQDNADDKLPFHEHPRWKQREDEWNKRFNDQEQRHQDDLKAIREEFGAAKKANAENTEIPSWFGGTQEQWDQYRDWNEHQLQAAEDRAIKRLGSSKEAEDKAVQEATDYMKSEIAGIESDKTLNPSGDKIDPNKLLKIVMDNDLIDSKGRWNYRAGWKIMQQSKGSTIPDKKKIAGAVGSDNKGESKPAAFKTSADFKKNRPW